MTAISQVVVVSDLHCGCQFGLCPDMDVTLDGGGIYQPSSLQRRVWAYWLEFWGSWVPEVTRGMPYAVVLNGDPLDGVHHQVNTLISSNYADQLAIAEACMRPALERAALFYFVRGTEAHGGQGGQYEELLAQRLDAMPDQTGHCSRFELRLQVGDALLDVQHHIATVGSTAYETTALMREFSIACEEAGRWHRQAPDVVIRGHRHRHAEVRVPTATGYGICVTTPGWQLKTPLTYRMPGARQSTPQLGGIVVRTGHADRVYTRSKVWSLERAPVERVEVADA